MTDFLLLIIAAGIGVLIFRKPGSQLEFPVQLERIFQPKRPPEIVPPIAPAPPESAAPPFSPQTMKATAAPTVKPAGQPPNKVTAVVLMILAIVYALFPLDPLPDFIPVLGWIDDIAIFMAAKKNLANAMKPPVIQA